MELVVQPDNLRLNIQSGQNLLDVLRDNAVPMSYSCMSGRCGTCRCKVTQGELSYSGPEAGRPPTGQDSYVLACQSVLTQSCTIEIPDMDEVVTHPAKIIKGMVTAIDALTHDIRRVRVTEYVFATLKPDDAVRISGPLGTSYLRQKHTGPMLCVGGGSGIAPIMSILRGAMAAGMHNPVHIYFGVRSAQDCFDVDRLQQLAIEHGNMQLHVVLATGPVSADQRSGLVTDAIRADLPDLQDWVGYFCGAPAMVEALSSVAKTLGMPPEKIHADAFYPSGI